MEDRQTLRHLLEMNSLQQQALGHVKATLELEAQRLARVVKLAGNGLEQLRALYHRSTLVLRP